MGPGCRPVTPTASAPRVRPGTDTINLFGGGQTHECPENYQGNIDVRPWIARSRVTMSLSERARTWCLREQQAMLAAIEICPMNTTYRR